MTKSEVMNCAAILAAGIMANQHKINVYDAYSAVELMDQIAEVISKQEKEDEIQYPTI